MTNKTRQLEEKFNQALPQIEQAALGNGKPRKFSPRDFMKAAEELQKVIVKNDKNDTAKT